MIERNPANATVWRVLKPLLLLTLPPPPLRILSARIFLIATDSPAFEGAVVVEGVGCVDEFDRRAEEEMVLLLFIKLFGC